MAYVNLANPSRRAPRYVDTSDFRAPFDSPTPTLTGLGATASDVTAKADAMKRCANPKLEQAGLVPVGMGPPAGGTCSLAYSIHSSGCPFRGEIQRYCKTKGITGTGLRAAVTKTHSHITDWMSQQALTQAAQATEKLRQQNMAKQASQYPWNAYSAKTAELQKRINEIGKELATPSGIPGSAPANEGYCRITVDGKLGPGTCGAAKILGIAYPPTCQSFATDCRGTFVRMGSGTVVKPKRTTTTTSYTTPQQQPPPQTEPAKKDLPKLPKSKPGFLGANALVFGIVALSVAAVGGATYVVGQKKGWWGKKPSGSKGAALGGLF